MEAAYHPCPYPYPYPYPPCRTSWAGDHRSRQAARYLAAAGIVAAAAADIAAVDAAGPDRNRAVGHGVGTGLCADRAAGLGIDTGRARAALAAGIRAAAAAVVDAAEAARHVAAQRRESWGGAVRLQ